jgi:hypothetical protein
MKEEDQRAEGRGQRAAGDAFSAVRLHADHGDVAEEIAGLVPGFRDPVS